MDARTLANKFWKAWNNDRASTVDLEKWIGDLLRTRDTEIAQAREKMTELTAHIEALNASGKQLIEQRGQLRAEADKQYQKGLRVFKGMCAKQRQLKGELAQAREKTAQLKEELYHYAQKYGEEAERDDRLRAERDAALRALEDSPARAGSDIEYPLGVFECALVNRLHAERDAVVGALEGLTNAALAGLKPLPSQVQAGFDALAQLPQAAERAKAQEHEAKIEAYEKVLMFLETDGQYGPKHFLCRWLTETIESHKDARDVQGTE